jgi:hypothetical protein
MSRLFERRPRMLAEGIKAALSRVAAKAPQT